MSIHFIIKDIRYLTIDQQQLPSIITYINQDQSYRKQKKATSESSELFFLHLSKISFRNNSNNMPPTNSNRCYSPQLPRRTSFSRAARHCECLLRVRGGRGSWEKLQIQLKTHQYQLYDILLDFLRWRSIFHPSTCLCINPLIFIYRSRQLSPNSGRSASSFKLISGEQSWISVSVGGLQSAMVTKLASFSDSTSLCFSDCLEATSLATDVFLHVFLREGGGEGGEGSQTDGGGD